MLSPMSRARDIHVTSYPPDSDNARRYNRRRGAVVSPGWVSEGAGSTDGVRHGSSRYPVRERSGTSRLLG